MLLSASPTLLTIFLLFQLLANPFLPCSGQNCKDYRDTDSPFRTAGRTCQTWRDKGFCINRFYTLAIKRENCDSTCCNCDAACPNGQPSA